VTWLLSVVVLLLLVLTGSLAALLLLVMAVVWERVRHDDLDPFSDGEPVQRLLREGRDTPR
jgi:uncharacterized iron-regulated membrane protein